jgi:DNA-binding LacI/PurR family transcriptional regulator
MELRYAQIRNEFEQRIMVGDLKPGDRLPAEVELSTRFDTSRATVARALRELEAKGLLSRRRGAGTFVSAPRIPARAAHRLAMFTPWVVQGESIGHFQSHVHAGLSSLCAQHDAELSLQGLSAVGRDFRTRLLDAADQIVARKTSVVFYCAAELDRDEMGLNCEVAEHLERRGCPVVLIDRDATSYPDRSRFPWLAYDNRRGATLLTRHLVEQGYERIAFVGIPRASTAVAHRLAGYIDGLGLSGRRYDPSLVFETDEPDLAFCQRMFAEARPDAVIAKDSHFAVRVGSAVLAEGRRIGPDVGIAWFDYDPAMSILHVPLTIVRQPVEPFVAAAYHLAMRVLNGTCVPAEQVIIPTQLVVGASTLRDP